MKLIFKIIQIHIYLDSSYAIYFIDFPDKPNKCAFNIQDYRDMTKKIG